MKRIWSFSYVYGSFEIFDETNLLFFICPNSHLEKCHFRWNRPNRSRIPTKHKDIWQTLWKKRLFGQPKRLISTCFLKLYETAKNTGIYGGLPKIEQVHPQIWTRLRSEKWRTREHLTNTRKTTTFLATGAPQDRHIPTVSRFLAKSTRFLSRHSKKVRKLTSAKKSQSSLPSERLCCWDSWIFSAARTKTDFVEKMTEFPHIGKVLLLEFLVFVQPPGRQLPFSEKSQSSPTSERLFCWNSWIFSASRTTTDSTNLTVSSLSSAVQFTWPKTLPKTFQKQIRLVSPAPFFVPPTPKAFGGLRSSRSVFNIIISYYHIIIVYYDIIS